MTRAIVPTGVLTRVRRWAGRTTSSPGTSRVRVAVVPAGVVALLVYVLPEFWAPAANWPLWDVRAYGWGGRQAAAGGGALYAPAAPFRFTYPPFAALLFAGFPVGVLKIVLTAGNLVALPVLCGLSLAAAGARRRPETVFAVSALALLTWPVAYTIHLGEVNLILAVLIGADLLRRRDGAWWQGAAGLALARGRRGGLRLGEACRAEGP